jgi:hypothetical protein
VLGARIVQKVSRQKERQIEKTGDRSVVLSVYENKEDLLELTLALTVSGFVKLTREQRLRRL